MTRPTEAERFWCKVEKTPTCWLWTKATTTGYGRFWTPGGLVLAHRYAYETLVGPIPAGLDLDHVCHNEDPTCPGGDNCLHRSCVNPDHLQPATRQQNLLRGMTLTRAHHEGRDCGFFGCGNCARFQTGIAA